MEEFRVISEFRMYSVSNHGRVIHISRGREMTLSRNAYGELTVGLWCGERQHRRAVRGIVAREFVEGQTEIFNTPIIMDGNRENLHADNLAWRPRWFALMYAQQFDQEEPWWFAGPVINIKTNVEYENIIEAAIATGSLIRDIRQSLMDHTRVFPEAGIFEFV